MKQTSNKALKIIATIFMAMTAAMNIMGGAGTTCAAFFTKNYPPYWGLIKPVDYRWLYQSFVILTIAVGIAGVAVTVGLIRGGKHAYRNALIVLIVGTVLNAIHYIASATIIGKAIPANMVFFTNVLTLIFFLVLLIPGIRQKVDFSKSGKTKDKSTGGGLAAMVSGTIVLSTPMWAGASHMYMGRNWVDVLAIPIYVFGSLLLVGGLALLARGTWKSQEIIGNQAEVNAR